MPNIFDIFNNRSSRIHAEQPSIYVNAYTVDHEIELPPITDARLANLRDEMYGIEAEAFPTRISVVISALEKVVQVVGMVAAAALVGGSLASPVIHGALGETGASLYLQIVATAMEAIWMIMLAVTNFRYGQQMDVHGHFDPLLKALAGTQKLLYPMMMIFEGLELLAGFGAPNKGGEFDDGYAQFSVEIDNILRSASPSPTEWSGDAATYYESKNQEQQNRVQKFAAADRSMANILEKQAHQVDRIRQGMAGTKLSFLGSMMALEPLLEQAAAACQAASLWRTGDPLSAEIQHQIAVSKTKLYMDLVGGAAFCATITFLGLIITLVVEAEENRQDIGKIKLTYNATAGAALGAAEFRH